MLHIFALQNDNDMDTIENAYSVMEKLMDEDKVYLNPRVSFRKVCRWLGVPVRDLDGMVRSELGVGGGELMARFRASEPGRLSRKYGIRCHF